MNELELPKLPEGYFFRVASDAWGFAWVEIRKSRKWFGSAELARASVDHKLPADEQIIAAAEWAAKKLARRFEASKFWTEFRAREGDYR